MAAKPLSVVREMSQLVIIMTVFGSGVRGKIKGKINRTVGLCRPSTVYHYIVAQFEQLNRSVDWVLSYWVHFTVLLFILVYVYFVYVYFVLLL